VRIAAGRFEQSPYFELYANPNTRVGVAANRFYAADNGEDPVETYWALRRKAVLFDVPEKPWLIEGPDALPFLEQILARPVGNLPEGRGRYAIACISDGDTVVGRVTASDWSPFLESGIGYVRFCKAGDWVGSGLKVKTGEGEPANCNIVSLPFYDTEKRIPRGLDPVGI
jgi:glycine cleavage system aminomethyltransferase T